MFRRIGSAILLTLFVENQTIQTGGRCVSLY
jgi:hypothetical protein